MFPFERSFDEIGLDTWIEEILEKYCDDWSLAEDFERMKEDDNLDLDDRTIKALKEFKRAWFDVYSVWEENDILDSWTARKKYPFNQNWEDIYVRDWVDYILEEF